MSHEETDASRTTSTLTITAQPGPDDATRCAGLLLVQAEARVKGSGLYEDGLIVAYLKEQVKDSTDIEEEISTREPDRTERRLGRRW